jgi:nucleoside diphosphate kinase
MAMGDCIAILNGKTFIKSTRHLNGTTNQQIAS